MNRLELKAVRRTRRKMRVRRRVLGTPERPRLSVTRSLQHISVQLIDDVSGRTLVAVSSMGKDLRSSVGYGGNKTAAAKVGTVLAERAKAAGVTKIVFDRNGYKYHGRVKALADAVREGGISF